MLAEKALHQMVVCGYALIGHDPAQAVHSVMSLKNMIRQGIKPVSGFSDISRKGIRRREFIRRINHTDYFYIYVPLLRTALKKCACITINLPRLFSCFSFLLYLVIRPAWD